MTATNFIAWIPRAALLLAWLAANNATALDEPATLTLLVKTVQQSDDDSVRASLLQGMLRGLEGRRNMDPPAGWSRLSEELAGSQNVSIRESANRLSQIFGDREANERALATLRNPDSPIEQRQAALASLVDQQYAALGADLNDLLEVPELRLNVIRAYGVIASSEAPKTLLSRYQSESPEIQRVIIETLATRKPYAIGLVDGIKQQIVSREQIPSYVARSLRDILGKQFTDVYGEIPELQHNASETIAKYKRLITTKAIAKADAGRGRTVFQKTCGACHQMYGEGGKIGPDLTGSNRANLDYFLLNSVAPSADVPEGYRTQLIQTIDGRLLTGVLAEEDDRRIILKTVDQPRVVIAKDDIEMRKLSDKSMMPEGQLDQMKRNDLFDLVKYMQTKTQVGAAR